MTSVRSFSLGRRGEAQWQRLHAAYRLSQKTGEIVLVASDSADVRAEVRRRLEAMASRLEVVAPGEEVALAIHALAKTKAEDEKVPVAWIEAPEPSPATASDMRWLEALAVLNVTRDALRMHGPCHVVLAGPRALHDLVRRRAPDLASFMAVVLLLDDTLEELVTQEGSLTWLHLSDLHVHNESWQQDHVLGALVRDLPTLLDERELQPDLLFVTGDLAASGQRTEYDGVVFVIDDVCKRMGLDRRQHVFVVPGNHDVDRSKISRLAKRDHASLLSLGSKELREAVGELLGDGKEFRLYGERLDEWCAFTETLLGRARAVSVERPWRSDVVDVRGLPVGVLSLCTVWASGPGDRKGSLILGERQIHDMVAEARDGGAQLVIALMHHPLHWLHDGEHSAVRDGVEREVDVILHGHVQEAHMALHVAAASANVEIGAGAAHGGLGENPHHGFSVGRLDLANGRLDLHGFTWSTRTGKWHADSGAPGADDRGRVSFPFSPARIAPEVARKGGQEVLATRLRHAAAKVYATVDFAGLRAGGPRRHVTLEQIFVPLHLGADELEGSLGMWVEQDDDPEDEELERGDEISPGEDEEQFSDEYVESDAHEFVSGRVSMEGLEGMLAAGHNIVVLGGPGSGKSTLSKHIASTTAQREGGPVPLLLTVRDWIAEGKREHLLDMAARQAAVSLSVRTDRAALEALCERGNVLLIVDGVDEAADPAVRRALRDQLHGFVAAYPCVPVLVTSRIAGYHEVPLDDEDFIELTLEPFDDESLEQFVRRWYDLVEDDPAARLRKRVDLLHALEVEPRAKELARNPLLATLIGMVHFSHAQLPGDRAKLYGLIIELLLITWPAERKRELLELHGAVQQPMLEKLALRLQEQRSSNDRSLTDAEVLLDFEQLELMLTDLLTERFAERTTLELRYLARKWSKWLVDGCGLLQEHQPGRVGFLHLSLMEYMAGRALFQRTAAAGYAAVATLVVARHDQAVWRETLLLMLGSENKNRELGKAVVERLLAVEQMNWSACVFGLALLREEVDMGGLHERLLERTCEAALAVYPGEWWVASKMLADVVRFGRARGNAIGMWLRDRLERETTECLAGVVALATEAISRDEILALLSARADRHATVLALLDFDCEHFVGQWARQSASPLETLAWARSTQPEFIVWKSLENAVSSTGSEWVLALLVRSSWITNVTSKAKGAALALCPQEDIYTRLKTVSWFVDDEPVVTAHLDPSVSSASLRNEPMALLKRFSEGFAFGTATGWGAKFVYTLSPARDPYVSFVRRLAQYFWMHLASGFLHDFIPTFDANIATHFSAAFVRAFVQLLAKYHSLEIESHRIEIQCGSMKPDSIFASSLWRQLIAADSTEKADLVCAKLVATMTAEMHAALVTADLIGNTNYITPLAILRTENRWLNLFFTPLVEYATRTHPLPTNPDLHALLLTYGLIQYQTTWEWPDCPHWRSWLSSDPPAHWLPAHVFHLIRSIQEPADPTHRALADAALDRNDWPELAQALRETTVIPTPPEVLALFDHGDGEADDPDDLPPPSTPT